MAPPQTPLSAVAGELLALDVHYEDDAGFARTGAVCFTHWTDPTPRASHVAMHADPAPYVPGAFFERELPALLPLVKRARARRPVGTVIVDGLVDLPDGRPGLGRHLHTALGSPKDLRIVGVAKNPFSGAPCEPVMRGDSAKPLWVSATSDLDQAVAAVASMHGPHRLPELLTWADHLARGHREPHAAPDVLELRWSGGLATLALSEHELPRAPHLPAPLGHREESLPAGGAGLDQAVEVVLRRQTGHDAWFAQLAARFEPELGSGTLGVHLCDAPPLGLSAVRGIHDALLVGMASVSPRPEGLLTLSRMRVLPVDSVDATWAGCAATLLRLCMADTVELGPSGLTRLARTTAEGHTRRR